VDTSRGGGLNVFVSKVALRNWRNFRNAEASLQLRTFVVGPNASGKSNFLDAFRFLRDIAKPGGGLQYAVKERGGLSAIRCLAARRYPDVEIEVELTDSSDGSTTWRYEIGIKQEPRGDRNPFLAYERVTRNGQILLNRPDLDDKEDKVRLTQTHLEQINTNAPFREIVRYLESTTYLHLVPQLVRYSRDFSGSGPAGDPFGRSFLERMGHVPEKTRKARLKLIEQALQHAVPQLTQLAFVTDSLEGGVPHLEAIYEHWRPQGAKQRERDFSDGTLRLIGFLWSLLESDSLLLLEEPELSLNPGIVRELAAIIYRLQRKRSRQVLATTHSSDLLSDRGIALEEILLLVPSENGTEIQVASDLRDIRALLEGGMNVAEAVLPRTIPQRTHQLSLFE
jgi:predicted ATPase